MTGRDVATLAQAYADLARAGVASVWDRDADDREVLVALVDADSRPIADAIAARYSLATATASLGGRETLRCTT